MSLILNDLVIQNAGAYKFSWKAFERYIELYQLTEDFQFFEDYDFKSLNLSKSQVC